MKLKKSIRQMDYVFPVWEGLRYRHGLDHGGLVDLARPPLRAGSSEENAARLRLPRLGIL